MGSTEDSSIECGAEGGRQRQGRTTVSSAVVGMGPRKASPNPFDMVEVEKGEEQREKCKWGGGRRRKKKDLDFIYK